MATISGLFPFFSCFHGNKLSPTTQTLDTELPFLKAPTHRTHSNREEWRHLN